MQQMILLTRSAIRAGLDEGKTPQIELTAEGLVLGQLKVARKDRRQKHLALVDNEGRPVRHPRNDAIVPVLMSVLKDIVEGEWEHLLGREQRRRRRRRRLP